MGKRFLSGRAVDPNLSSFKINVEDGSLMGQERMLGLCRPF